MRKIYWLISGIVLLAASARAGEVTKHGTDILHFSVVEQFSNQGVLADARGRVDVHINKQGKADHQEIRVRLAGLDVNGTYQLLGQVGDDTNLVVLLDFNPDRNGKADIRGRDQGPRHPHSSAGHIFGRVPPEVQPLTSLGELIVTDTNGAAILIADLTAPDKFEYLVKRDVSAGSVQARLEIKANAQNAKMRFGAKGLEPGAEYSLAVDGNVVTSGTANDEGRLDLRAEFDNTADVLALSSVALLDASSNTVVSTSFP